MPVLWTAFALTMFFVRVSSGSDLASIFKEANRLALEGNVKETTEAFYKGFEFLGNNEYSKALFEDVIDIFTVEMEREYKRSKDKGQFFLRFWQMQDPTPATLENERLVEHYQRLDYARRKYHSPQPRGYDDRGMIYVRFGPPTDSVQLPLSTYCFENECWVYYDMGSPISFDFYSRGGLFCTFKSLDDYESKINEAGQQIILDAKEYFYGARQYMSLEYAKYYAYVVSKKTQKMLRLIRGVVIPTDTFSKSDVDADLNKILMNQSRLPQVVTEFSRRMKKLPVGIGMARFLKNNQTVLDISYGIPWKELSIDSIPSGGVTADLDIAWAIRDSSYRIKAQNKRQSTIQHSGDLSSSDEVHINQIQEVLSQKESYFSIEISDTSARKMYAKTYRIESLENDENRLVLSDIQPALKVENLMAGSQDTMFIKGNLKVIPYPSSTVFQNRPVTYYMEVYNLLLGPEGMTNYTVEYGLGTAKKKFSQRINPFWKESTALKTEFAQAGNRRNEQVYFSLDMGKVKPGDYTLTIKVRDEIAKESRESSVQIQVKEG